MEYHKGFVNPKHGRRKTILTQIFMAKLIKANLFIHVPSFEEDKVGIFQMGDLVGKMGWLQDQNTITS